MLNQPRHGSHGPSECTVMVVDDESATLDVIESLLQQGGYERFVFVDDSREAMVEAEANQPDVILLDLVMPNVDGLELLEQLRRHPRLKRTPVLILTSKTDPAAKLQALELGVSDFLAKPVDPSELALRLRNTLTVKAHQDRLTYYDPLSGLPNRLRFTEWLDEFLADLPSTETNAALLHLRLGRFGEISDAYGRPARDEALRTMAERLQSCLHPAEIMGNPNAPEMQLLCQAAEGEFLILLEEAGRPERAARIARHLLARLETPLVVADREFVLTGHIGVTLIPDDGEDAETLLDNASLALSHAQGLGGSGFQFHDETLNAETRERLHLESLLRGAVEREEVHLHYQPKVDVESGRVVGAEALMRWHSPVLGQVPPDRFIPVAEESDLIVRLGSWAIRTVCWQIRTWLDAGLPPICVAVNVSSKQFRTGDLASVVRSSLEDFRLEGRHLVIELTESMITEDPAETARILDGLKALGVAISLDDFGTGYSSLSNLKRFPITELKIDRSFVKGVPDDSDDAAITAAVIAMGHALGMRLVAEGVETEAQVDFLRERGCEIYQGFLCSRPLAATDWPMLLSQLGTED